MMLFCLDIYVLVALSSSIYCQDASISYLLRSKLCVQRVWHEADKEWSWYKKSKLCFLNYASCVSLKIRMGEAKGVKGCQIDGNRRKLDFG